MKLLNILIPMLAFGMSHSISFAQAKKNVCSITINSTEEIDLFKKNLNPNLWNFVELTSFNSSEEGEEQNWLKNSCRQKIQCDILVVSGHFGGAFFGSSQFSMAMEELETSACDADCNGIIQKPKEVFLFGCNTLAGKEADHRTPEEYMNVLLADGFSHDQAAEVVAFRYSDLGSSFKGRMAQVFSTTPRIYGFSSVGPSGKTVEPLLKSYLTQSKANYSGFDQYNQTIGTLQNSKLFTALQGSAIAQTPGLSFLDANYAKAQRPYCYLADEKKTHLQKLQYIKTSLLSGRTLTILPYILKFIAELNLANYSFTDAEQSVLNELSQSEKIRIDFNRLLALKGDVYLKARVDTLNLMKSFNFITREAFDNKILATLELDFSRPTSTGKKDAICSLDIKFPSLKISNFSRDVNTLKLILCLEPADPKIHMMIAETMQKDPSESVRIEASYTLLRIKPSSPQVHMMIAESMKNDSSPQVKNYTGQFLKEIRSEDPKIHMILAEIMKNDTNESARETATSILFHPAPVDPQIHMMIAETMQKDSSSTVRGLAISALGLIKPTNPQIHMMIAEAMQKDIDSFRRELAVKALSDIKPTNPQIHMMVAETMQKDSDWQVRKLAALALRDFKTTNPQIHMMIAHVMRKDSDDFVRYCATKALIDLRTKDLQILSMMTETMKSDSFDALRKLAADGLVALSKPSKD